MGVPADHMTKHLLELVKLSNQRVEKQDPFCFWQVDGHKLDNKHLVLWYEKTYSATADFVFRDYDLLKANLQNTKIDLDHDYNLEFLKHLRSKCGNVKLMYSGGTDSATILDMANRHDIALDEVITVVMQDINLPSNTELKNIALPGVEKYKRVIRKYSQLEYTFEDVGNHFDDDYAVFSSPCDTEFPVGFAAAKYTAFKKYHKQTGTCIISGIDKPAIVYYNGEWYAFCLDGAVAWGDQSIPNLVPFYLDAENIKGFVRDCQLFRNYLLEEKMVTNDFLQFFQPNQTTEHCRMLRRLEIEGLHHQFFNGHVQHNEKSQLRVKECLGQNKFTTLIKYFRALETFYEIFPEAKTNTGLHKYNNNGKFAWFVNIDSLEVHTQKELIPHGFVKKQIK